MKKIDSYTTKYMWALDGCLHADATGAPNVRIEDEDEDIPLLAKADSITCNQRDQEMMELSVLSIHWSITNTKVGLRLLCRANDKRLKKQYLSNPELATTITDLLVATCHTDRFHELGKSTTAKLSDDEIPVELQPFVIQARSWELFMKKHQHGLHFCVAEVSGEGFLLLRINEGSLLLGDTVEKPDVEDWEDWDAGRSSKIGEFFQFDLVTEPPTIQDELVYWEIPNEKVLVILEHSNCSERVAKHFNYLESFQGWIKAKKAFSLRMELASQRNDKEDADKREEKRLSTLNKLLGL